MNDFESDGRLSRKSSLKKGKSDADSNGKKLKERVEEFKLWQNDETFVQLEYEQRRSRKKQQKGVIRSDKRLQMSKFCYAPSFLTISAGICFLLLSTIDGLAVNTVLWQKQIYFQITGAALLVIGLAWLMATAVYTYKREDTVRAKYGLPSLYEAAAMNSPSLKNTQDTMTFTCDFVERGSSHGRLSRMTSMESKASLPSNLGWSFSSTSTAVSWLHKHQKEHRSFARRSLRKDNSDSALDTYFARSRILSWQTQTSMDGTKDGEKKDGEHADDNGDPKLVTDGNSDSQAYSSASTTSSGYHSNISSPIQQTPKATFTFGQPFSDSAATEQGDLSVLYPATEQRRRLLSTSISEHCDISDETQESSDLVVSAPREHCCQPSPVSKQSKISFSDSATEQCKTLLPRSTSEHGDVPDTKKRSDFLYGELRDTDRQSSLVSVPLVPKIIVKTISS